MEGGVVEVEAAWPPATFETATPTGIRKRNGYAMAGLGLWMMWEGSPKGRRKPLWSLTHLGSGHMICSLLGDVRTAFSVAYEIATAGDWTFEGLAGFKNQFPDAAERVKEIAARYPKVVRFTGGVTGGDEGQARTIAMGRTS